MAKAAQKPYLAQKQAEKDAANAADFDKGKDCYDTWEKNKDKADKRAVASKNRADALGYLRPLAAKANSKSPLFKDAVRMVNALTKG